MEKVKCLHCGTDNPENYKYCSNCGYELPKTVTENVDSKSQQLEKNKTDKKKKIVELIVGAIFFGVSYFAVQQLFFKPPSLDKAMMEMVSEINKSCPIMIDQETRLDNAITLPKNIFQYNYTLVNIEKATTDTVEMRKFLEPIIINNMKTNPQRKCQRDHQTPLNYY